MSKVYISWFYFFSVWWTFWCSCRNKIKERYYKVIYKSNVIRLILEIFRLNNTQYMCLNVYNICVYPLQITSLIQRSTQSQSLSAKKGRLKARRWRRWRRYIWMKSQSSTSVKKILYQINVLVHTIKYLTCSVMSLMNNCIIHNLIYLCWFSKYEKVF